MSPRTRMMLAVLFLLAASVYFAPLQAQREEPLREYQGLFGPDRTDPPGTHSLNLEASIYGGDEANQFSAGSGRLFDPRAEARGASTGIDADIAYSRRTERLSLSVAGGGGYRDYPSLKGMATGNGWLGVEFDAALNRRTRLRARQAMTYAPFYSPFALGSPSSLGWSNGVAPLLVLPGNAGVVRRPVIDYEGAFALTRALAPRTSLEASFQLTRGGLTEVGVPVTDQAMGVSIRHRLNEHLTLRAGYAYRHALPGAGTSRPGLFQAHDVDVGIDYQRPLSRSRRTAFGFRSASAAVPRRGGGEYRLLGSAYLQHDIGESWQVRADYSRDFQSILGVAVPSFSNAMTATAGGHAGRAVDVRLSASYLTGEFVSLRGARTLNNVSAGARMRVALSRSVALFGQYFYYHYLFATQIDLPALTPQGIDRQGVRVGLTFWVPIIDKGRTGGR